MASSTDRIEKQTVLKAPLERVWQAISDSQQFGIWFGVRFDGPFTAGARLTGKMVPTEVDAAIAEQQKSFEGELFDITVERIEAMRHLSFRWHPYALEPGMDHSKEPTTLVVFELEEAPQGTRLTVIESGFDSIPLDRRAAAFESNEGGWEAQLTLIEKYLARSA